MRVSSPPSMCFKLKESFWKPKEQIYNINFYTVSEKWYKTGVKWDNWNVRFDVKCELVALKCKESSYGWWEPGGEAGAAVSPLWWGLAEPSWRLIELLCRTRTLALRHSGRWSPAPQIDSRPVRMARLKSVSVNRRPEIGWRYLFNVKTQPSGDGKLWKILKRKWELGMRRLQGDFSCNMHGPQWHGRPPIPFSTWIELVNNKD